MCRGKGRRGADAMKEKDFVLGRDEEDTVVDVSDLLCKWGWREGDTLTKVEVLQFFWPVCCQKTCIVFPVVWETS